MITFESNESPILHFGRHLVVMCCTVDAKLAAICGHFDNARVLNQSVRTFLSILNFVNEVESPKR